MSPGPTKTQVRRLRNSATPSGKCKAEGDGPRRTTDSKRVIPPCSDHFQVTLSSERCDLRRDLRIVSVSKSSLTAGSRPPGKYFTVVCTHAATPRWHTQSWSQCSDVQGMLKEASSHLSMPSCGSAHRQRGGMQVDQCPAPTGETWLESDKSLPTSLRAFGRGFCFCSS